MVVFAISGLVCLGRKIMLDLPRLLQESPQVMRRAIAKAIEPKPSTRCAGTSTQRYPPCIVSRTAGASNSFPVGRLVDLPHP